MKAIVLSAAILLLSACSAPDFYDAEGNAIYLAELNEKFLIVNYWATWCAPCIREIPELNELAREHAADVNLLGVNFDHPGPEALPGEIRKMKIEFPVAATEPAQLLEIPVPQVLPTTYVIAPGGELLVTLVGPQTKASLLAAIYPEAVSVPGSGE